MNKNIRGDTYMEFDLENPLTSLKEFQSDDIPDLFASEADHMPSMSYLQSLKTSDFYASFRQEALSLIVQAESSCNLDPFIPYLAVNYMDRFISRQQIPRGNVWILRLLVVSCLSVAAKMKNTQFSLSNFQKEDGNIFDTHTIQKMELLILDALNWRMRSITPFSFVHFFVSLIELQDPQLTQALKGRATGIIFRAHNETKILEFNPSIITASAILMASYELFPLQFPSLKSSISSCQYVNQEKLFKCFNVMQEMLVTEGYESTLDTGHSSPGTPLSVLDRCHCSKSSESEDTTISTTTTTTTATLNETTTTTTVIAEKREAKRRKLNGYSGKNTYRLSQIQKCS